MTDKTKVDGASELITAAREEHDTLKHDLQTMIEERDYHEQRVATLHKLVREMVEALETLKKDSALGMGEKWVRACEKAEAVLAKVKLEIGEGRE